MLSGLGINTPQEPLSDEESDRLDKYIVWLSGMAPSEYEALPRLERIEYIEVAKSWLLNHLYLTRTATKKQ